MSENIFWEIEGIKGESTSAQGKGMIELLSFSHGVAMPLTAGNSNTSRAHGRTVHHDITVTTHFDIATPTLNLKCSSGEDIKSMKIHMWKADKAAKPIKYITYTLESCIITSVSVSAGGSSQPLVSVTVNYNKINWEYSKQKLTQPGGSEGKSAAKWDLEKNEGS